MECARFLVMDLDRARGCPSSGLSVWIRRTACIALRSGAILPFSAGSPLRNSALFGYSKCQSRKQAKNPLKTEKRSYISIGRRERNEGNNQSAGPGSHLKGYRVSLNDSVTMANNLTKTIVLSSPSPGQITNQSQFT